MQIKLAGFNVDTEILEQLNNRENKGTESGLSLTPETFSSAYARISRSSKDVTALRKQARQDVEKARKSNQKIIFGMGHHSVAEHAVFNFDVIGVSRLALEELEKFRLVSYTEKSQRYVTLNGDFVVPKEIGDDVVSVALFKEVLAKQNAFYFKSFHILKDYLFEKYPERTVKKSDRNVLEGWAKEDARYILSLATEGQVGMTINARNLEHLFRRFSMSRRREVRELGILLYQLVEKVAPSLILFPEPSKFEASLMDNSFKDYLNTHCGDVEINGDISYTCDDLYKLRILHHSEDADHRILASFLSEYNGIDYMQAFEMVNIMEADQVEKIFQHMFSNMEFFDSPSRHFELPDIIFQANVSASNFAQLKRHRMATLLTGDYNTKLGNMVPENIRINGLEEEFMQIIETTNAAYLKLKETYGGAADYILTNSHSRPVTMKMNLREAYHFIRLRADDHAQWDIRDLALQLEKKIIELMPYSTQMLCGKSEYVSKFEGIYNRKPDLLI